MIAKKRCLDGVARDICALTNLRSGWTKPLVEKITA